MNAITLRLDMHHLALVLIVRSLSSSPGSAFEGSRFEFDNVLECYAKKRENIHREKDVDRLPTA